jgi:hypothetical protein
MASATVALDVAVTPVEVYGGQSIASVTQSLYLPTAPNGTVTLQIKMHNVRWDGPGPIIELKFLEIVTEGISISPKHAQMVWKQYQMIFTTGPVFEI